MTNSIESLNNSFYNFANTDDSQDSNQSNQVDFLELMITQMQNQDPLNPMESGDFLAQLAQFETASGMTDLQNSFDNMTSVLQSSQALEASTLVGRSVLINGNIVPIQQGENFKGAVDVVSGASSITVSIFAQSGQLVDEITFQNPPAGIFDYTWDGTDSDGNPVSDGQYIAEARGTYDGQDFALNTYLESIVNSVSLNPQSGGALNLANNISVNIDDVQQVR